ncbi:hypothetical protein HWQ46_17840 [Shewanella sp. D64]|uniref:hypothetical protein n=1 Tax=unclassified Shewanella TaxID=196818 RepID=UPI0022BA47DA|nr:MULTISPECIES: hypothetical protein [unclassified Shewanella]MEC4727410.1 hypothetical protein [Shewanella sp. D64]MEC4739565.1 hypothetical protein [Shewanella sp. E94]WBJ96052.1 hypothetical protein HWQ47_02655 [Shewanella sp. MTB7]
MKQTSMRTPAILLVALITLVSGCSNNSQPFVSSSNELKVNITELGKYWLVKDGVLDWSSLLNEHNNRSSFTATFTINHDGQIENLHLDKVIGNFKVDQQMYADFSKQTFMATKMNHRHQAVSITAQIN